MSPELAAQRCEERARAAVAPTGSLGVGIGSGGDIDSRISVGVTTDFIRGRDPYEVYDACVRRQSGQGPIRPLDLGRRGGRTGPVTR